MRRGRWAARPLAGWHHEVPGECGRGAGRAGRRTFPAGSVRPSGRSYRSARRVSESLLPRSAFRPPAAHGAFVSHSAFAPARLPEAESEAVYWGALNSRDLMRVAGEQ